MHKRYTIYAQSDAQFCEIPVFYGETALRGKFIRVRSGLFVDIGLERPGSTSERLTFPPRGDANGFDFGT